MGSLFKKSLLQAVQENDLPAVKSAITSGAHVNETKEGTLPLNVAAMNGQREMVELLITRGAEVNAKDKEGTTPSVYLQRPRCQ